MKKLIGILAISGALAFTGCGNDRDNFVITNTNNTVVSAPVCANDAYAVNQNATLTVAAATGVLANDTPNGATVAFQTASAQGGTVTGAQDGSFTYVPATNFQGMDTFTYTLGNSGGVVTCTVTITVNAVNGFFVDATNGDDGTGNFTGGLPFATVQGAVDAAPINTDIVVRPGSYTTANLKNGQRLLGNGSGLAVNPQGTVRPSFTGPIDLADGNTVDFVRVAGTAGDAINGDGQNGGTVTNCEIADTPDGSLGSGVNAEGSSGTWVVSNNVMTNLDAIAVDIRTSGNDQLTVTISGNQITGGDLSAIGLLSDGTSGFTGFVTGNTITGNNTSTGNAVEIVCQGSSNFCLDLEDNQNDDVYLLAGLTGGVPAPVFNVEQLGVLTTAQPGGAGNTGTVTVEGGVGFFAPTDQNDNFCTP